MQNHTLILVSSDQAHQRAVLSQILGAPAAVPPVISQAKPAVPAAAPIDIRKVRKVKLDEERRALPDNAAKHHAIELPDFGLIFPNIRAFKVPDWHRRADPLQDFRLFGERCAVPEPEELCLIVDRTRCDPAVDPNFFPELRTDDWYWTDRPHPSLSGAAFFVLLSLGLVYCYGRSNSGLVLPVLRVGSAASQ